MRINNHHRLEKHPSFDPPLASLYFWLLVLSCNFGFSLPLSPRVNRYSIFIEKRAIRKTSYLFGHWACRILPRSSSKLISSSNSIV